MSALASEQSVLSPNGTPGTPAPLLPDEIVLDDLKDLMQTVTETSQQLQQTHITLQREVARLQRELAEANTQLQRSRSLTALGGMAAGIAHEIRNPLGSIQLYVQMLAEDVNDHPDQAALCLKIDRAVTDLDAIVRDVLLFSREVGINSRSIDTATLLERAREGCVALIERSGVELAVDVDIELEFIADEQLLVQALGNVIRNAIEAMTDHEAGDRTLDRRLRLSAQRKIVTCPNGRLESRCVLSVEDTGPGIADDVIERMFNPFFTTRATGTGLGLAIVHRIVDAHRGHINVNRIQPHGTRFELCLRDVPPSSDDAKDVTAAANACPEIEIETLTCPQELEHGR